MYAKIWAALRKIPGQEKKWAMTKTIRSLTPMILLTICSLLAMSWIRKDWRSQLEALLETNRATMKDYTSLTRTLLGVQSDSPAQTVTMSQPPRPEASTLLDVPFGDLPVDEDLMREYQEHLDSFGTLSGEPARTNPMVEQIVPGQMPSTLG
jgi:hypothetical protein